MAVDAQRIWERKGLNNNVIIGIYIADMCFRYCATKSRSLQSFDVLTGFDEYAQNKSD